MEKCLHISIAPHAITEFLGLPITSTLITSWIVVVILVLGAFFIGRSLAMTPGKGQVAVEGVIAFVFGYVKDAFENMKIAQRYFPLIMTIFVYVLAVNLFGLLPFNEAIGIRSGNEFIPLLYPVNADLNIPLALAIISFLTIEISGIIHLGFLPYVRKFLNFSSPIQFAVGVLEIISNLARLVSLSFRLFGNILAGHILIIVIMFFLPYLAPLPFITFELFVALMQAVIFALLTLFFIKISIDEPHGEVQGGKTHSV